MQSYDKRKERKTYLTVLAIFLEVTKCGNLRAKCGWAYQKCEGGSRLDNTNVHCFIVVSHFWTLSKGQQCSLQTTQTAAEWKQEKTFMRPNSQPSNLTGGEGTPKPFQEVSSHCKRAFMIHCVWQLATSRRRHATCTTDNRRHLSRVCVSDSDRLSLPCLLLLSIYIPLSRFTGIISPPGPKSPTPFQMSSFLSANKFCFSPAPVRQLVSRVRYRQKRVTKHVLG